MFQLARVSAHVPKAYGVLFSRAGAWFGVEHAVVVASETLSVIKESFRSFARILFILCLPVLAKFQQSFTIICIISMFKCKFSIRKQWKVIYLPL